MFEINTSTDYTTEVAPETYTMLKKDETVTEALKPGTAIPGLIDGTDGESPIGTWYLFGESEDEVASAVNDIESGTVEVSKNGDEYTLKFDFLDEDENILFKGTYVGTLTYIDVTPSRGSRHDAAGPSAKGRARQSTTRGRSGLRIALAASVPPDAGGHLFAQGPPARAARSPTGREKGGRKERGGRTGTAPHAFAKKSRKNRMRKHYRSIPEKRDAQESHTHSRRRRQESALREAGLSYRTTCSAPGIKTPRNRRRIRMATQICCRYRPTNRLPGGGVPSLFAGSSYRTEKRKCIRKHTLSRVRRIGQNDRKPGDSAPGECRRNSPGKRTDIRPSAVRTSRFGRLDAVSVRMSAQPEERASATRCRQGFRRPFPEDTNSNSNSPTILP